MTRSEVIPGGDAILPGGMRSVIAALQEKIEEGEKGEIQLGEVVTKIDWSGGHGDKVTHKDILIIDLDWF